MALEYKICPHCGEQKSLDAFHKNKARSDGRQSVCKACQRGYVRAHYKKHPAYYKAKAVAHTQAKRKKIRRLIRRAKDVPCADCGIRFPYYVMDFDHIDGEKRFNIGRGLSNWSLREVEREIAKCEVVCANCHRIREHRRRKEI